MCVVKSSVLVPGDVLQLPVPIRRADLLPGQSSAPEGLRGRDPAHVHPKGKNVALLSIYFTVLVWIIICH